MAQELQKKKKELMELQKMKTAMELQKIEEEIAKSREVREKEVAMMFSPLLNIPSFFLFQALSKPATKAVKSDQVCIQQIKIICDLMSIEDPSSETTPLLSPQTQSRRRYESVLQSQNTKLMNSFSEQHRRVVGVLAV